MYNEHTLKYPLSDVYTILAIMLNAIYLFIMLAVFCNTLIIRPYLFVIRLLCFIFMNQILRKRFTNHGVYHFLKLVMNVIKKSAYKVITIALYFILCINHAHSIGNFLVAICAPWPMNILAYTYLIYFCVLEILYAHYSPQLYMSIHEIAMLQVVLYGIICTSMCIMMPISPAIFFTVISIHGTKIGLDYILAQYHALYCNNEPRVETVDEKTIDPAMKEYLKSMVMHNNTFHVPNNKYNTEAHNSAEKATSLLKRDADCFSL